MLTSLLPQIVIACAAVAAALYLATAKRSAPLTKQEAAILWKIHKQRTNCQSSTWRPLTQRTTGVITGFKCECGCHYMQKVPLLGGRKQVQTPIYRQKCIHARHEPALEQPFN